MYIAGYIVTGFLVAGAYAIGRLRGKWGRYERTALAIPLTIAALASPVQVLVGDWAARDVATSQPIKLAALEGLAHDDQRRARAPARLVRRRTGQVRHRDPQTALVARLPQPERDRHRPRLRAGRSTSRRSTSCASPSRRWSASARCSRCSASVYLVDPDPATAPARARRGSTAPSRSPGPPRVVALIAGWVTTEVGRQPWVVYRVMRTVRSRHRRRAHLVGYARSRSSTSPSPAASSGCSASRARAAGDATSAAAPAARPAG